MSREEENAEPKQSYKRNSTDDGTDDDLGVLVLFGRVGAGGNSDGVLGRVAAGGEDAVQSYVPSAVIVRSVSRRKALLNQDVHISVPEECATHDRRGPCRVGPSFDVAHADSTDVGPQVGRLDRDAGAVEVHVDRHVGGRARDRPRKRQVVIVHWDAVGSDSASGHDVRLSALDSRV